MAFDVDGKLRQSNFAVLLSQSRTYGLSESQGRERIDRIVESIRDSWLEAADIGGLSRANRDHLWGLQILNPAAFYGY